MLSSIKQYKLNPNKTKKDLIKAGFKNGGWQEQFKDPKVSYSILLHDSIELHIEIETDTMKFNCYDNVLVLDDDFCQPYTPFYKNKEFEFLKKVIKKYNEVMDQFVKKGIFEYL